MNKFIISFLAISALFLSYGISNAQVLLVTADDVCVQGTGSLNASLYRVDPDTAAFKEIGPIGFSGVGGLAQIGDGRLVASARADTNGDKISILIEINPFTGEGRLIGTIGSSNGPGCGRINDLTYDPATDTLYATGIQCDNAPSDFDVRLLTINPDTGAGTIIGETGFFIAGNALAISSNGTLFSSGGCSNVVYTINPQTGVGTFNFFPSTELTVLDPFTGQVTSIGQLPDCADGIEFVTLPPRNIPTLSQWGLIAMAGILGFVGFMVIRRK